MQVARPLAKNKLLLCLDAFGTLYKPNIAVPAAYALAATRHGVNCGLTEVTASLPVDIWRPEDYASVSETFNEAFKEESTANPNYGKATGLGAEEWWANVIRGTFRPFAHTKNHKEVPKALISELLKRYSSSEGYTFFPDAQRFFELIKEARTNPSLFTGRKWEKVIVGVITNSDDRVPSILTSFGLKVGPRRVGTLSEALPEHSLNDDVNFVVLSYDVGHEKPDGRIFTAATKQLEEMIKSSEPSQGLGALDDYRKLYVGDSIEKDYFGAKDAGWDALLIHRPVSDGEIKLRVRDKEFIKHKVAQRNGGVVGKKVRFVRGLDELMNWYPRMGKKAKKLAKKDRV